MIGVLSRFGARDICDFFESHGVRLKVEPGGKVFPVSNKSQTVIDCLVRCVSQAGVKTLLRARVVDLVCREDGVYEAVLKDGRRFEAEYVLIATGGASMPHEWAKRMGHKIVDCVPSLFTFGIEDGRIRDLAGVSVSDCEVSLGKGFVQQGPLLITHWGLSGPVVLTLSSFAARLLSEREYVMDCSVDWIPRLKQDDKIAGLKAARVSRGGKKVVSGCPICAEFPKRLWRSLVISVGVEEDLRWADVSNKMMNRMAQVLDHCVFEVKKKGEFKEEFVVAGGIKLSGLDMKTFESRHSPRLYFAGETVDVDGRTGGYNLEFAWSSAYIAGAAIAQSIKSSREET